MLNGKSNPGAGEIAQLVKCLLYKTVHLNSDSQYARKSRAWWHTPIAQALAVRARRGSMCTHEAHCRARRAESMSLKFSERICYKR